MFKFILSKVFDKTYIRIFFRVIGFIIFILLTAIAILVYGLHTLSDTRFQAARDKSLILNAAQYMRQTTNDLTRLSRLYVITGDQQYKDEYNNILDIRYGRKKPPPEYQNLYWQDLDTNVETTQNEFESLHDRALRLPMLQEELFWLLNSLAESDRLAVIELAAFELVEREDSTPDKREEATEMLFSPSYIETQQRIISPLDNLLKEVNDRYTEIDKKVNRQVANIFFAIGFVMLFWIIFLIFIRQFVEIKILQPVSYIIKDIGRFQRGEEMSKPMFYPDEIGMMTTGLYEMKNRMDISYLELEKVSFTDALTGLYNRHYFYQVAEDSMRLALRNRYSMSLIICDIDHFKKVNDTYGHLVGDVALKHVSSTIAANLRSSDVCARYGGEEFVILLRNSTMEEGVHVAEKIRVSIENSACQHEDVTLNLTMSFGVTDTDGNEEMSKVIDDADKALYQSKTSGRNRVTTSAMLNEGEDGAASSSDDGVAPSPEDGPAPSLDDVAASLSEDGTASSPDDDAASSSEDDASSSRN